ncbi:Serine/threonine-protein kinase PknD [subsurface metagenome]
MLELTALGLITAFGVDLIASAAYPWVASKWRAAGITNHDLQKALRKAYEDALSSIEFGFRQREGLLDFLGKRRLHQEITGNFNRVFLVPFASKKNLSEHEFRNLARNSARYCKMLRQAADQALPIEDILGTNIEDLLLTGRTLEGADDLRKLNESAKAGLMARVRGVVGIPELFLDLLEYKDLLTWSIVFFLGETIKSDERVRSILTHSELQRIREEQGRQYQEQAVRLESALQSQLASFEQCLSPIRDNFSEVLGCLDRLEAELAQITKFLERLVGLVGQDRSLSAKERKQLQAGLSPTFDLTARYEFDEKSTLGFGAVATVYKAVHKGLGQERAVKVLKAEYRNDEEIVERFLREAAVLGSLRHPNIVQICDAGGGGPGLDFYIEMEFIDGVTLRNFIKTKEFDWPHTLKFIKQLASAIQKMHESGIIHRDLGPRNIMVDRNDNLKVMDFGIAKIVGIEGLTRDGQVVGTIDYMAPEQARGERVDERADIYAFGTIVYEMCTRRLPSTPLMPLRQYELCVPEWLESIVAKCLAPERDQRFASMREVVTAIEEAEERARPRVMCVVHPDRDAIGTCNDCTKVICKDCAITIKGKAYCGECAEKVLRPAPVVLPKEPAKPTEGIKVKKVPVPRQPARPAEGVKVELPECPECGVKLRPNAKFCHKCRARVEKSELAKPTEGIKVKKVPVPRQPAKPAEGVKEELPRCSECGINLRPKETFCHKCGARVEESEQHS